MAYKDKHGYKRQPSNLVHRHRAYHHIYLKNRKKYPLRFEAYEVHHIDGDKNNNRMDNLAVLTPEEHDKAHQVLKRKEEFYNAFGISIEEFEEIKKELDILEISVEQAEEDFYDLTKKDEKFFNEADIFGLLDKGALETRLHTLRRAWDTLLIKYMKEKNKKIRNEKIKKGIKTGFNKIFKR